MPPYEHLLSGLSEDEFELFLYDLEHNDVDEMSLPSAACTDPCVMFDVNKQNPTNGLRVAAYRKMVAKTRKMADLRRFLSGKKTVDTFSLTGFAVEVARQRKSETLHCENVRM